MGKKNDYLARQKAKSRTLQDATRQTFVQYMTDTLMFTLNDPEVLGKDVFGHARWMPGAGTMTSSSMP